MDIKQAVDLIVSIFGQFNREQRRGLIKLLKAVKVKLDFDYPEGTKPTPSSETQTTQTL